MKYIVIPIAKVLAALLTIAILPLLYFIIGLIDLWNFEFKHIPDFWEATKVSFNDWITVDYYKHNTPF